MISQKKMYDLSVFGTSNKDISKDYGVCSAEIKSNLLTYAYKNDLPAPSVLRAMIGGALIEVGLQDYTTQFNYKVNPVNRFRLKKRLKELRADLERHDLPKYADLMKGYAPMLTWSHLAHLFDYPLQELKAQSHHKDTGVFFFEKDEIVFPLDEDKFAYNARMGGVSFDAIASTLYCSRQTARARYLSYAKKNNLPALSSFKDHKSNRKVAYEASIHKDAHTWYHVLRDSPYSTIEAVRCACHHYHQNEAKGETPQDMAIDELMWEVDEARQTMLESIKEYETLEGVLGSRVGN